MVADAAGGPPPGGYGEHDQAQRDHRQTHEFEHQRVHVRDLLDLLVQLVGAALIVS